LSTLARRKVIFGPKHQLVMETQNDLGSLYYCKGDLDHAELLFTEIYENSNNLIEDNPRRYLTALSNYASTCQALGKLDKAFELFLTANQIYMSKFGEDDIDSWIKISQFGDAIFINQCLAYRTIWPGAFNQKISLKKRLDTNILIKEKIYKLVNQKYQIQLPRLEHIRDYLKLHWSLVALKRAKVKNAICFSSKSFKS
jgi:tetratricopeptide (TPR) repeat protein